MKFAIEIYLDSSAAKILVDLWERLKSDGLAEPQNEKRPYVPHISLAVTDSLDVDEFSRATAQIARRHRSFSLLFTHWGIFRSEKEILFLAPKPCAALTQLHSEVFKNCENRGLSIWHFYHPDRWVPHCTITA